MRVVTILLMAVTCILAGACGTAADADPTPNTDVARRHAIRAKRYEGNAQPRAGPHVAERQAAVVLGHHRGIAEANVFRPLGWEEPRHGPFGLAGIAPRPDGPRALITRGDRPSGLYVQVGGDVGGGYAVLSIGGRTVTLAGGALGEVTLELDPSVVGSRGAAPGRGGGPPLDTRHGAGAAAWYPSAACPRRSSSSPSPIARV